MKESYESNNEHTELLTVKDLSRRLKIGRDTAYALMRSKAFPSICIGKRYFVTEQALGRWLKDYEHKQFAI